MGSFLPPENLAVGRAPRFIAMADLDADGSTDLTVADAETGISVLFQDTIVAGIFSEPVNVFPAADTFEINDLDGDGWPDFAFTDDDSVVVALQDALDPGSFLDASVLESGLQPVAVSAGDLNGDGAPDLAVANSLHPDTSKTESASVSIIFQDPAAPGNFTEAPIHLDVSRYPVRTAIADLNADGKADVVLVHYDLVSVLFHGPSLPGSFLPVVDIPETEAFFVWSIDIGDFNGDGFLDLAVAGGRRPFDEGLQVLLQDGAMPGHFLPPIVLQR